MSERRPFLLDQRHLARAKESMECSAITAPELWWPPNAMHGPPLGRFGKRLVDVTVASVALILLSPLMVLIAAAVRFTMGGPVLFGHGRIGHKGRTFRCYKFRTMIVGADEVLRVPCKQPAGREGMARDAEAPQ